MSETVQGEAAAVVVGLDQISIEGNFNPRHYRSDDGMAELTRSVANRGVIQPIVIRPNGEGGYFVVAGERRYRAAKAASLDTIPAVVREMSDADALALAVAENDKRENISAAEEARVAKRALAECDGSHEDAALLLGWTRRTLDARLLLMHATDAVLDALEQRKINTGIAQLLASLPDVTQGASLAHVIENNLTVDQLKGSLGQFTRELAHARFDTTDCQGCPFNSSTQASLFEFSVGAGRCSNHACWADKNTAHIESVRMEQQAEVPAVYLDNARTSDSYTTLFEDGERGVGAEQYTACHSCEFYGSLVATAPGREGKVTSGLCFNMTCNAAKIKAHLKACAEATGQTNAQAKSATDSSASATYGAGNASIAGATDGAQAQPKKSAPKATAGNPKAVTDQADAFVRKQAVLEFKQHGCVGDALSVFGLFAQSDMATNKDIQKIAEYFSGKHSRKADHDLYAGLVAASQEARDRARSALITHLLGQRTNTDFHSCDWQAMAKAAVSTTAPDLSRSFTVDESFLKAHTKSGMGALLSEAGFDTWYDEREGTGSFAKLLKKKISLIVAAVFPDSGDGFDFSGFVPSVVSQQAGISVITEDASQTEK